jgi:hypothetical protein
MIMCISYKKKYPPSPPKEKKTMFQMDLFFLVSYFKKDNVLNNPISDICCVGHQTRMIHNNQLRTIIFGWLNFLGV